MASAGPSREGTEMRQSSTHPSSVAEWTPNVHEGPSTSPPGSLQYEALHRVKAARKPLRSSPLAGPALSGERPSISTERVNTLPSRASPFFLSFRPRSILLAEPLSCFLRSKSSQSDMKRSSFQIYTSPSSRPTSSSDVPPARLSPSPSPPALGHSKTSARYRASVSDSGCEGAAFARTASPGHCKRLSLNTRYISIARPPPVIISPTESTFRPQGEVIYTQQSRSLSTPPHTPPHSRSRHGKRTTLDPRWQEESELESESPTSLIAEPSSPLSPLRLPSPTQPKSILKHASSSALRHFSSASSGLNSAQAAATDVPQAKTPPKDNSWFVNSPYAITPRFTRLGLNAPGVVLPLSAKEYKRRTTTAASLVGAGSMSTKSSGGSSVRSSTSSKMSRRASSPSMFSLAASVTQDNAHPDPVDIESHGGPGPRSAVGMSAETPNEGKSNDSPSFVISSSPASTSLPAATEAQPHWLSLSLYSQSQTESSAFASQSHSCSHAKYESEPLPEWLCALSQSSAASSALSLSLTLPSSVPDSTTLASSQTLSVLLSESQTEISSVCTSVDEKSEETALPLHGARAGVEGERGGEEANKEAVGDVGAEGEAVTVTVTVEIPSLRLKKRRSVLEKVKSFCWSSADASAEDNKASCAQYGATNVVNLPLPAVAAAASSVRRSNTRHSLPIMAFNSSGDAWVVPDPKDDATRRASNSKERPLEPLGGVAPQVPPATLPTIREAEGQSHRLSGRTRRGTEKALNDSDVGVEVRYLDVGIVDSGIRKAHWGHRRNGSVRKVWESLRGGRGSRGPQTSA